MQSIEAGQKESRYSFLAKNIFWLILGWIVSAVVPVIALPIITAYLDPESFGIIALFMVESSLLGGLYGLGLGAFASRMIYKYDRRNRQKCFQYLGVILFYLIVFSLLGLLISLPFVRILKRLILKDVFFPYPFLFYIPAIYGFFDNIYSFTINSFMSLQQTKKYFICNITGVLLLIPLQVAGLVWLGFTWIEVVTLQLIVKIVVVLLSLWLLKENLSFSFKRLKIIKLALMYSLPYILLNFSSWIQQQIDKIFLGGMHSLSYVGVYAVGAKVSEGFRFFSRPVAASIKPEISKRLDSNESGIQRDITDFFNLFFQLSLFAILTISIFSQEIITLFANAKYSGAYRIIPFAIFGIMFAELSGILHLKFIYKNKTMLFPFITFLGAFLNLSLNYYLIPKFEIVGAAFAAALANLGVLFVCYFISQRLHFSRYDMKKNISLLVVTVFIIFLIQNMLLTSRIAILLKSVIILFFGFILYKYILCTNERFRGLRYASINTLKIKYRSMWNKGE